MKPKQKILAIARNVDPTRLGHIDSAAFIDNSAGLWTEGPGMRVLASYALVYVLRGQGRFRDVRGVDCTVFAGDLIVVFPGLAHQYGTESTQEPWDELFICFHGPVFDLWRDQKLLDPSRPVIRLQPIDYWSAHLASAVGGANAATLQEVRANAMVVPSSFFNLPDENGVAYDWPESDGSERNHLAQICRLQNVLADILEHQRGQDVGGISHEDHQWLETARAAIDQIPLAAVVDWNALARGLRMSYVGFRKRFARLSGTPPAQYRARRIIEWSCGRLDQHEILMRNIAEECGFCDEYHFSKRFKQIMGISPSKFRHRHERGTFGGPLRNRSNPLLFHEH